jgi:excisionase family DNA binding protein
MAKRAHGNLQIVQPQAPTPSKQSTPHPALARTASTKSTPPAIQEPTPPAQPASQGRHVPRLALSVEESAEAIGISASMLWQSIRAGTIPTVRVGKRVLIRVVDLEDWLASLVHHAM